MADMTPPAGAAASVAMPSRTTLALVNAWATSSGASGLSKAQP